jgi:hypothetical protein
VEQYVTARHGAQMQEPVRSVMTSLRTISSRNSPGRSGRVFTATYFNPTPTRQRFSPLGPPKRPVVKHVDYCNSSFVNLEILGALCRYVNLIGLANPIGRHGGGPEVISPAEPSGVAIAPTGNSRERIAARSCN